jgi:hypothetical protein
VLLHTDSQIKLAKGAIRMSNSMKALLAGAALAGLMTGTSAKLNAQTLDQNQGKAGIKAVSMSDNGKDSKDKDKTERAKTLVRGRVAVIPATTAAKARIPAKARAAAQPMDQKCQTINPSRTRTKSTSTPNGSGLKVPTLFFL